MNNCIIPRNAAACKQNDYSRGEVSLCNNNDSLIIALNRNSDFFQESSGVTSRIPCHPQVAIGPSSPLLGSFKFLPYLSSLDKLKVSLWLDGEGLSVLINRLKTFKDEFDSEKLGGDHVQERSFDFGWEGVTFNMQRRGAKHYSFFLKSGDICLFFSTHKATASFPNCQIDVGSMSCWYPGWKETFDRFTTLLDQLGCTIRRQTLTEYHLTADLIGVEFRRTCLFNQSNFITRADDIKPHYHKRKPCYIAIGKGDTMVKCYDKTAELDREGEALKKEFFYQYWFDCLGYVPEHVTRIECQIRRPVSKELGVHTVDDLASKLNSVWEYFVGSDHENGWARLTSEPVTEEDIANKHQSRYETAFIWQFVRSVRFNDAEMLQLKRRKLAPQVDVQRSVKAATSLFLKVCAVEGMHPHDLEGHIDNSINLMRKAFQDRYKKDSVAYARKVEVVLNSSRNNFFADLYENKHPDSKDCFKKYTYQRQYYRTNQNTYTKVYCVDSNGVGYWETVT